MKLVREHINERFTEDSDPVYDLGIGLLNNFDKIAISILKKDTKKMFFTVWIEGKNVTIYCNSPNIRKTKYITTQKQFKDYADKIIYEKLKLNDIFKFINITGEYYNAGETSFHVYYELFKDSKKNVKAKRGMGWEKSNKINLEINSDRL